MNPETKRHIDGARQVLVGVVPNPVSQIDQITYALIYKFMDDMDQSSISEGGEPSFFTGILEPYSWTKLMDSRLGNQQRMNLYVDAFLKFSEAEQLPELFRNILKSAFLPYRSPEVLWLFLKEIDYFDYSHPEELGNAYEYLLSIMGSQGDAGQFRTPRHIIDFIVDVIQPTENDKILDPACGTGGFLVKAYQHILEQHQGDQKLTQSQKLKIMDQFEGYDIDPGMVRIAQVNMFLHQFKSPKIVQYDTLSMEEKWNDRFDIIMANPPFMSPKGGIKPHSKFSVQSTRSEVLFVDYIMNHLKPKGRAGIIVPEGIIFQSGNAYKQLRKNLVNDGLYAVVSLPSGVFQPYSGVKTSILFFNNEIAKQREEILFVKVENDGFDLGANKRPINKNDLPEAIEILNKWKHNEKPDSKKALLVTKTKLSENGDYNLSGDRYRITTVYSNTKWPMVRFDDFVFFQEGPGIRNWQFTTEGIKLLNVKNIVDGQIILDNSDKYISKIEFEQKYKHFLIEDGDIILASSGATYGKNAFFHDPGYPVMVNTSNIRLHPRPGKSILQGYIKLILDSNSFKSQIDKLITGAAQPNFGPLHLKQIVFPLPPLEIQQQIVEELDSYQNIISGARQIIANWKPVIDSNESIEMIKVGKVVDFFSGVTLAIGDCEDINGIPIISIADIAEDGSLKLDNIRKISTNKNVNLLKKGDLLFNWRNGSKNLVGKTAYFDLDGEYIFASFLLCIRPKKDLIDNKYLWFLLNKYRAEGKYMDFMRTNINGLFNREELKDVLIPIPSLEIQKQIVERIESERALIESAKKLITLYTEKISTTLAKLWEEKEEK